MKRTLLTVVLTLATVGWDVGFVLTAMNLFGASLIQALLVLVLADAGIFLLMSIEVALVKSTLRRLFY